MDQRAETGEDAGEAPVAFIGAGAMAEAIVSGLLRSGRSPGGVTVCDPSADRRKTFVEQYSVRALEVDEAVPQAGTVVLAVKPKDIRGVLGDIREHLRPDTLVVSIAAGITTAVLEKGLSEGTAVVRVMPNTPALVGEGISALSGGTHCTQPQLESAAELMRSCGAALTVPEAYQDSVTAVSGSGPAYVFAVIDAMIEGGVLLGLPRDTARELVVQTVYGAAALVKETGEHPGLLRERVSSPGGTTVAALRELDERAVRAAFLSAMEAAAHRSAELSGTDS